MELKGVLRGGTGVELKGVLSGGTAVGCGGTGVELKGVLSGGTVVGQRWAVVKQRRAETQKETVQIPARVHLQVEHRNKLYKTNYKTNSKPIQQQINSIPTQLKHVSIV